MRQIKNVAIVGLVVMFILLGGCQNWKQKYDTCQAEKDNLEALFEGTQDSLKQCQAENEQYRQQLTAAQKDLAAQQNKLQNMKNLFPGEDAKWDPRKGTITVTLESGVLFDSGKVTLKQNAKSRLDNIAGVIRQQYPDKEISVVGHTDTDPIRKSKWTDNWQLSTERALAVTRYLIKKGISAKQLAAVGRGEFQPVGSQKSQNRRVEIIVNMYR